MKAVGSCVLALVAIFLCLCGVGYVLPAGQMVQRTSIYRADADRLWDGLVDFAEHSRWRSGVDRVQALADRGGNPVWREVGEGYERTFEVTSSTAPRHLVLTFTDPRHWFTGSWSVDLIDDRGGTRVTITESGEVSNVLMRLMCRTLVDRGEEIGVFLVDLGGVVGERVHATKVHTPVQTVGLGLK